MFKLKIPPPIYMIVAASLMWILDRLAPVTELVALPWNNVGFGFILIALFADGISLIQFFRVHTSINPLHPENTKLLVTSGMYRFTRNPMYMGLLLVLFGWAILLGSLTPFLVLPVFILAITVQQIIPEERILEQKFGQQYKDYKQSVSRWL